MPLVTLAQAEWPEGREPTWLPTPEGDGFEGKYGSVRRFVVTDDKGSARFDIPIYTEASHANIVLYGYHPRGVKIGLINVECPMAGCVDVNDTPRFWRVLRGFVNRGEDVLQTIRRILAEKAGVVDHRGFEKIGEINPNPSYFNSSGPVFAVQVDLNAVCEIAPTCGEKISKVRFFFAHEIRGIISRGEHEGALSSDAVSFMALMQFFCYYPSVMREATQL